MSSVGTGGSAPTDGSAVVALDAAPPSADVDPPIQPHRRPRTGTVLALALGLGVGLGVAALSGQLRSRTQVDRTVEVWLATASDPTVTRFVSSTADGPSEQVTWRVVNTGPRPVSLRAVHLAGAGLALSGPTSDVSLPTGRVVRVQLTLAIPSCAAALRARPTASVEVTTADRSLRTTHALAGDDLLGVREFVAEQCSPSRHGGSLYS